MANSLLLFLHSWLRWVVVVALVFGVARGVGALVKHAPWTPLDRMAQLVTVASVDLQVFLGLALWFVSPLTPTAEGMGFKTVMHESTLRYFSVEHPVGMV